MQYKVAYVYHSLSTRGGLERVLTDKMNYMADMLEYEVYLFTTDQFDDLPAYPVSPKIHWINFREMRYHNIYKVRYPKRYFLLKRFNRYLKKKLEASLADIQPDFLISTTSFAMEVVAELKTSAYKICESHISYPYIMKAGPKHRYMPKLEYCFKSLYDIQFRRIIRKYDELVVLTNDDFRYWAPYRSSVVIPNPVTLYPETFSETTSQSIISVGRLHGQKGYDLLISAWKQIAAKYPQWHINIFGDGTERQKYLDMIQKSGLSNSIFIHPSSANIYSEYDKAGFLVLSSRAEGFGLVLAEAMSCGRPCVSYNCESGPADIIQDGVDGLLVQPESISELAEKIEWMITHEPERKYMGRKARESSARFSISSIMPMWVSLFNRITHTDC